LDATIKMDLLVRYVGGAIEEKSGQILFQ